MNAKREMLEALRITHQRGTLTRPAMLIGAVLVGSLGMSDHEKLALVLALASDEHGDQVRELLRRISEADVNAGLDFEPFEKLASGD